MLYTHNDFGIYICYILLSYVRSSFQAYWVVGHHETSGVMKVRERRGRDKESWGEGIILPHVFLHIN